MMRIPIGLGQPAVEAIELIASGDKVVTRLRGVGKHDGEIFGAPPSGKPLDVKAVAIHRIADGKIAEHWSAIDSAALLAQLGLIDLPH